MKGEYFDVCVYDRDSSETLKTPFTLDGFVSERPPIRGYTLTEV